MRRLKIHRADWLKDGTRVAKCGAKTKPGREIQIAEEIKFANCEKCRKARKSGAVLPGEI